MICIISFLENVHEISIAVILICSFFYVRHFKKMKRERKLSFFELAIYLITQLAIIGWLSSFVLLRYII